MKDNQTKYPQLRFKGFTDSWVQRNLADLSDGFSYGLNAAAKEYDGVHGYLRITDIDEVSHSFLPEGLTSPDVPEDQLTDYRMDEQSIVYARTGASTGKTYIYRDSDGELYYAGFLIRQKVNKENSAQFVYQNTLTKAWERYVQVMSQRSGQPGINAQEVGRFELAIPEKAEQDKIAHLFNSLDNLIAANQRKLDLLKEQKKGYLQKMFPKNGAKVPELRLAGFADAWEQRKLGDYLSLPKKEKVEITNARDLMTLKLHLRGIEAGTGRETLSLGSTVYYKRSAGQFLYGKQNFFNGSMAIIPKKFDGKATSGDVPALDINGINSGYLYTYVSRHDYWKAKEGDASGTGSKRIHESTLLKFGIMVPVNNAEQQKIGSFFKQLDDTITLHQRKLEKLQELKKGYLQKMFC